MIISCSYKLKPKNSPYKIIKFIGESQIRYTFMKNKTHMGKWLREEMVTMGPAFIKLGQFLSTRNDLADKEIINELKKLQDDITPVPFSEVESILNTIKANDIFLNFEQIPIATASIGQVHKATLKKSGKEVAVKIQKPNVSKQIKDDLETLKSITFFLKNFENSTFEEFDNFIYQYEKFLSTELDYKLELRNMLRFKEDFIDNEFVTIPKVYQSYSSENILVMEYIPSLKITDIATFKNKGYDTKIIAENLINIFLKMIITNGFVHCDPHPGNIGYVESTNKIVLYDYGNVVKLSDEFKSQINNMIFAIYQKDVNEFVELLVKLDIVLIKEQSEKVDLKIFFRSFFSYLETLNFDELKSTVIKQTSSPNFKINPDFLSLFRVFSLLDGTITLLKKEFNYIEALQPFITDMFMDINFFDYRARKDIQKIQSYPDVINNTDQNIVKVNKRVSTITNSMEYYRNIIFLFILIDHYYQPQYYFIMFFIYVATKYLN